MLTAGDQAGPGRQLSTQSRPSPAATEGGALFEVCVPFKTGGGRASGSSPVGDLPYRNVRIRKREPGHSRLRFVCGDAMLADISASGEKADTSWSQAEGASSFGVVGIARKLACSASSARGMVNTACRRQVRASHAPTSRSTVWRCIGLTMLPCST